MKRQPKVTRPVIVCLSNDLSPVFRFMTGGWYEFRKRGTPEAETLMAKARQEISAGKNVPDTIRRLRRAGFRVTREKFDGIFVAEMEP